MAEARDTLFRQWSMLRRLPRYPRRMSTQEMVAYLRDQGFSTALEFENWVTTALNRGMRE